MTYDNDEQDEELLHHDVTLDPEGERLKRIQAMYDTAEGELGKAMVKDNAEVDQLIYHRHILREAVINMTQNRLVGPEGFNTLSLGCGTGKLYESSIEGVKLNVDGIDISPYEGHRNPEMRFFQGSILNSPEAFDLKDKYHFIDSVFVMRYINAIPENLLADMYQRGKVVGVIDSFRELTEDDALAERLQEAVSVIESGENFDTIADVLNNPIIAKAYLLTNWLDKLMTGGYMAHTITLQPATNEENSIHRTSSSVPRQIKSLRQILERRTDLNYLDFANVFSKKVKNEMSASLGFLKALATEDVRKEHEDHGYFNRIPDVQAALTITRRMAQKTGGDLEIDLDIMDAADTAYIKIKKLG